MIEQQQNWFDKLAKDREDSANILEKPSMRGIKNSVVEKYSDQAHFIYELLQNANDAKATKSSFQLTTDGLYFRHNGKVLFSVSNPDKEDEDKENDRLGHINSITAIANSNKTESSIGKFGVGFKAVFQYTETPYIYDPNFQFKIDRFIVPIKLESDLSDRQKDETVFYFPFNKAEMSAEKAHSDILEKLKKLVFPTLFLSNLQEVKWKADNEIGEYTKKSIHQKKAENITYEKIELYQQIGLNQTAEKLYLFSRSTEGNHSYSIGFFLDEKDKLIPKQFSAFCFFPTKETTNLNFILHAPFLLTDSREGIRRSKEHNTEMVELLSQLAADSLLILKELKLIDDDIVKIIPYRKPGESDLFAPFYIAIKENFQKKELLPAKNRIFVTKGNAYWSSVQKLNQLFSDEQLGQFIGDDNAKWVFTTKGRDELNRVNKELANYLDEITRVWLDENDFLKGFSYENGMKQNGITSDFIVKQDRKWLIKFYEWLAETDDRKSIAKEKPFFLNKNGKAVPVFNKNGKLNLYFPDNDGDDYETLNTELFEKGSKQLFQKFGIREHTVKDEIEDAITKFRSEELAPEKFLAKAFKYFKNECPQDEIDTFIDKIKDLSFIPCYSIEKGDNYVSIGRNLFYPTEKLVVFYEEKPATWFANVAKLKEQYPNDHRTLDNFLKKLGVNDKEPTLRDSVYEIAIPKLENGGSIDTHQCFNLFFQYYRTLSFEEVPKFINDIKNLPFILCSSKNNVDTLDRSCAKDLYFPTEDLVTYFETKPSTKFVEIEEYHSFITNESEEIFKNFLLELGVLEIPKLITKSNCTLIDGCHAILETVKKGGDKEKSLLLWSILVKNNSYLQPQRINFRGTLENRNLSDLRGFEWLLSKDNEFVAPYEITINELADEYEKESYHAKQLIDLLQFKPLVELTETERKLQVLNEFENDGYDENRIRKLIEEDKVKQNATSSRNGNSRNSNNTGSDLDDRDFEQSKTSKIEKTIKDLDDLQNEFTLKQKGNKNKSQETEIKPEINFDENEEFAKGIEVLKKRLEIKKSRVDLVENINNNVKYSYDWFEAYLQLLTTYGEKQDAQKQKSISFQEIKPYKADNKYFLLCGASSYISPEIENADDFKVSFVFGNGKRENITVEGVSKKGQDLLIYCREPLSGNTLSRLSNIFKVEINFTPVIDLLDRLYKAFINGNNIDKWENIQEAMPSLNFIYGPPGTGKTTTLCNNINDILSENPNAKFLVLTPTNKAADVVCKKLQDINPDIYAVRLSHPTDPELEGSGIYVDTLDNKSLHDINVVTSTIHRLPYFEINGEKDGDNFEYKLFKHRNFDYVIFDEASMTGLHYITFAVMALFKTNSNTNFIVTGDPKQIPPVIEIDEKELENFDFQDENIYKMMNLESFNPEEQTIRGIDTIKNLDTQYRSIPQIGQLFSELSYSSLLKHDRAMNRKETKQLPEKFRKLISSNVTYIDIPLNEDNSIYKVNKLFYSSYHIYCTILISEIVKYFDSINENEQWTIGLIAPYKAQAILLNKLITSYGISENVRVFSDTVHGFQGDECDIVFFVCNPNNYFYSGHEKSLLSKEYIYNVAISRAKDYLIVLHPYTAVSNPFINKIGHSYRDNFGNTKILNGKDIEKALFNDENYIENNSYVSGHDNINVFGLSEMKYFIKANDTAIDIQLRDVKEHKTDENGFK